MRTARKRLAALSAVVLVASLAACSSDAEPPTGRDELIRFGIALPQTGTNAQYGEYFTQGFELALARINESGGVDGRYIELQYEDTQADPAQAAPVAQKFVDDPSILASIGDFGTSASAAASPVYQAGGLVQFAFSASASTVTEPGDYVFATWVSQELEAPRLADFALTKGSSQAVFYRDTDWGADAHGFFDERSGEIGLDTVYETAYDPESTDLRPLLLSAAAENPEVIVLISYAADGALITAQARELGIDVPIVGIGSTYGQQFIELAGDAAEGFETLGYFTPNNDDPKVQEFLGAFEDKYGIAIPSDYAIRAYDALNILAWAAGEDATREGIRDALTEGEDIPTILYGPITFSENRRVPDAEQFALVVQGGEFVLVE
jgi:branched-chain amino acid transport system substrate-binding protein